MTTAGETLDPRRDPNHFPPLAEAIPLGIQHILAMFVSNVTPALLVAGAAGLSTGDEDVVVTLVQASMLFAGIATLGQTHGLGPVGARLPIVQGTSFAFLPMMLPLVAGKGTEGLSILFAGALVGGLFHLSLAPLVKRLRFALPPLVTGIVVLLIGLSLVRVGIQYAAGGVPAMGTPAYGAPLSWSLALVTIAVTLGLRIFAKGLLGTASVLLGLIAGYVVALAIGRVDFGAVGEAAWISTPQVMPFGLQFTFAAVAGFCAMVLVSGIETIGDVSAIAESGAGREATDKELTGAVAADGLGTALAAVFGALPNSSFSQNVGLVAMTGVMSRHVVALGAVFLIICGLVPKIGALIISIPIEVLGGSVIIMFGMVAGAGISMLSSVTWNQRNLLIAALAISVGLGLQLEPEAVAGLPELPRILMTSGVVPAAFLAVTLNLLMPNREGALSSPAH